jgi:hypothetical protein
VRAPICAAPKSPTTTKQKDLVVADAVDCVVRMITEEVERLDGGRRVEFLIQLRDDIAHLLESTATGDANEEARIQ